ncbi:hypothetical protein PAMP_016804 [Pampus punctatissimus]
MVQSGGDDGCCTCRKYVAQTETHEDHQDMDQRTSRDLPITSREGMVKSGLNRRSLSECESLQDPTSAGHPDSRTVTNRDDGQKLTSAYADLQQHRSDGVHRKPCPVSSYVAQPNHLDGEEDDNLIKPKKLANPVKSSKSHQELHRELLSSYKRSDCVKFVKKRADAARQQPPTSQACTAEDAGKVFTSSPHSRSLFLTQNALTPRTKQGRLFLFSFIIQEEN